MKQLPILILAATQVWAGVRMRTETTDVKTNAVIVQNILVDGSRIRMNMKSPQTDMSIIMLLEGDNPKMLMIDNTKGEYREMDKATMDQMGAQVSSAMSQVQEQMKNMSPEQRAMMEKMMKGRMPGMQAAAAPARIVYSAKGSSTMNGFKCTQYEGTREGAKVSEVCAAEPSQISLTAADFQAFEKMREFFAGMMKNMSAFAPQSLSEFSDPGLKGFPVHSEGYRDGQVTVKMDLKEIQRASFSDADFSPGNAKKVEMPGGPPRRR